MGTPADWLIRSTHDRALPQGVKLWAAATEGAPLGEIAFTRESRHGMKARQVRQHVWLTNREAMTLQEAIELIEWYRARWEIELVGPEQINALKPCYTKAKPVPLKQDDRNRISA